MLFFWDNHITSKHASALLDIIKSTVESNPNEKNIIFLGDYVYHFTYDRKALLQLFTYFIDLARQGKNVSILAWNHDRIATHFVFEEGKQTLQLLNHAGITFITEPQIKEIEWISCYFVPFYTPQETHFPKDRYALLHEDTHPWSQISRKINNIVQETLTTRIEKNPKKKLLLIHHRYIANTPFPGQQAQFSRKSPALDPVLLDNDNIMMISGHLHAPFCRKNYLCTGSIRHTSPLEINQQKFVYRMDPSSRTVEALPVSYNPYVHKKIGEHENIITKETLTTTLEEIFESSLKNLQSGNRSVASSSVPPITLQNTTLTLLSESLESDIITQAVDETVRSELWAVKHKLVLKADASLFEDLTSASLDLKKSFADRKELLRRFLEEKYGPWAVRYIQLLEKEKIL